MIAGMQPERKITVHVPADLLRHAQQASGQGSFLGNAPRPGPLKRFSARGRK